MIVDQKHIDFYKKIADDLFLSMVLTDYGADKKDLLLHLTDSVTKIYKHLKYNSFKSVVIYTPIDSTTSLSEIAGANPTTILSYYNLSPLSGENIVIEVKPNGDLHYSINFTFDINAHRNAAIIYNFVKATETETIFGKASDKKLPSIPDADSYFAIQTYKDLEKALEDYGTKIARHSDSCPYLKSSWYDERTKLCFSAKPEHKLRDSLHLFLKSLRNAEARPEQVVDKSHPVDIKVTFQLASHIALIEIKWIGISLNKKGKVSSSYTGKNAITRVNKGAKQLSEYMDANLIMASTHTSKGYLVVFDARRDNLNIVINSISKADGMKFENEHLTIKPEYHKTRDDFAKPIRYFMQPNYMTP